MTATDEAFPYRVVSQPVRIPIERRATDPAADAADLTRRVAQVSRGAARAAVLGVSDGLVTNICLILGVAGAQASAGSVRLAGFASLIAGAFSMAAGEWVSVRSQVELYGGLIGGLRPLGSRHPQLGVDEKGAPLGAAGFGGGTGQKARTQPPP